MKRRGRGKLAALLACEGMLLVMVAGLVFWDDLARGYYLSCLQADPDLFFDYLEGNAAQEAAVEEFARVSQGKDFLFKLLDQAILRRFSALEQVRKDPSHQQGLLCAVVFIGERDFELKVRRLPYAYDEEQATAPASGIPAHWHGPLRRFLPGLKGKTHRTEEWPRLRWSFATLGEIQAMVDRDRQAGRPPLLPEGAFATSEPSDPVVIGGPHGEEAVAILANSLRWRGARYYIVRALGELGAEARGAAPGIRAVLAAEGADHDATLPGDSFFRAAAEEALVNIEAAAPAPNPGRTAE